MRISCSTSPNSSTSGPTMRSFSFETAASNPRPASTETHSRSSTFGSSICICSRRPRVRELMKKSGAM